MAGEPTGDSHGTGETTDTAARRIRRFARVARWTVLAGFVAVICLLAGFAGFVEKVAAMKVPGNAARADAIVVLTGGQKRIESALGLLHRGAAPRLLISGVNPTTTRGEIRRLTNSSKALFSCCVDIGHDAIDTIGNAYETARWIRERGYKHVFLVTNNYHMPRSLMELRRVDPDTDFVAYPVINADLGGSAWLARPQVVRHLLSEYVKYTLAGARNFIGAATGTGLRTDGRGSATAQATKHLQ